MAQRLDVIFDRWPSYRMPGAALRTALEMFFVPPLFAYYARRLHDIGLPGWPGPPLVLATAALGFWHELPFRTSFAIAELPSSLEYVRMACVIAFYAIMLWAPQRHANRYGSDPRTDAFATASA
ncbi:DUF805 domain-containing protein [Sphingomonas sp. KR3-1]|uniref:DUF805 domain-containing protein n=1 Tax=Sphingomonas sp. KR3-1 TaxID=3156611 RepID=UPI0032B4B539